MFKTVSLRQLQEKYLKNSIIINHCPLLNPLDSESVSEDNPLCCNVIEAMKTLLNCL